MHAKQAVNGVAVRLGGIEDRPLGEPSSSSPLALPGPPSAVVPSPARSRGRPAKLIGTGRRGKLPPEPLTHGEVRRVMMLCKPRGSTGRRNRAILALLWRCGLRVSEALALRPCDVDVEAGSVRVLAGKGQKSRLVGCDGQTLACVARWVERRSELGIASDLLFTTLAGRRVSTSYIRNLLKRLGRKAGIAKRVHPHGLRHTHAVELLEEGVSIGIISKQLGHASIATTARYLDHISPADVVNLIRQRTW